MTRRLIAALFGALLLSQTAYAQHTGFLADEANVLGAEERPKIREAIEATYQATGARVCVRTISNANGEDVKHIAVRTLNEWNPGTKSVMILVCLEPRKIYVQPGTDLKYAFDEGTASAICRNTIAPHLSKSEHFAGLAAGIDAIQARLTTRVSADHPAASVTEPVYQEPWTFLGLTAKTWIIIAVVLLLLILLVWIAANSNSRGGGSSSSFFFFSDSGGSSSSSYSSGGDSGGSSWGGGSCDGGGGGGGDF